MQSHSDIRILGSGGNQSEAAAQQGRLSALELRHLVFGLDGWLRRRYGIREFNNDSECIFRVQADRTSMQLTLSDGTAVRPGDPILELHLWNEQIPAIGPEGPTLSWARQVVHALGFSLRKLAQFLERNPDYDEVRVIHADMSLAPSSRREQLVRMAERFGFEAIGTSGPRSLPRRLHQAGQNILISMLVLAVNPRAFRASVLRRRGTDIYMSRERLMRRLAIPSGANGHTPDLEHRACSVPAAQPVSR